MFIINNDIVNMEPTKEFFINILVRDIKLEKAILDLIDNSIDSVKETAKDLSNYKIRLTLSKKMFVIDDNCRGIVKDKAINYAFKFGNDNSESSRPFSIGHYGIGMKRAFFRIGSKITMESATKQDFFPLILDVDKWRSIPEWNIKFKNHGINDGSKLIGTKIKINRLKEEAINKLSNEDFINYLRESISKTYRDVIKRGITIIVNNKIIVTSIRISEKEIIRYSIDTGNYTAIINISRDISNYDESGWYVYLNDRLVVIADKTDLTGWNIGSEEQYYGIRGYVHAKSKKEGVLPFTTTKEGLDTSNPIYEELKFYMIKILKEALPKISSKDLTTIRYDKPRDEVEKLKEYLKVKYAKNVGEKTYEEYIKRKRL